MSAEDRRASRRKTRSIDYSKEQVFSDDDVFEDSAAKTDSPPPPPPPPPPPTRKSRGRPRKSDDDYGASIDDAYDFVGKGTSGTRYRYVEKGYDPNALPIREKYAYSPEHEADGSPKIELIVGRRAIGSKKVNPPTSDDEEVPQAKTKNTSRQHHIEYEYLVKYKGTSYLHLEWKSASDLESMNKSAKTLYRRYLKKLEVANVDGDTSIEDPSFDPSLSQPQKVVCEKEQEVLVELSDKELLEWEKEREKEMAEYKEDEEELKHKQEKNQEAESDTTSSTPLNDSQEEEKKDENLSPSHCLDPISPSDSIEVKMNKIRTTLNKDGLYYPSIPGSDNAYRDGYITEPPKKPRASYLLFQCLHRSDFQKRYGGATQGGIMTILGDTWRAMVEDEQMPYLLLAKEEVDLYEKERQLLEKAQKPNELWQPLRRCMMVIDRLKADSFSQIFLEPVDTTMFLDYNDFIDQPMDIGTIRKKLLNKKYQAPEIFARDVRKVWNNCKIYNQHGSAIWHVADYMSKQFERLYHAWVLAFRERYLRWANPKARPWETTCRRCDGKCGVRDEDMVLCDFCDAMYGLKCIGLKKVPEGVWHCKDCRTAGKDGKMRVYSALAEQAARKRAELGEVPKKVKRRRAYLVKWSGLGYEHCTWETVDDINDDSLIKEYRRLNNMIPDEPEITEKDLKPILENVEILSSKKEDPLMTDYRSMLHAQTLIFYFAKFGLTLPKPVAKLAGPQTLSCTFPPSISGIQCSISSLVLSTSRGHNSQNLPPPLILSHVLNSEYDAVIPITSAGLMMNVGEVYGSIAFLGYRSFPDGSRGPSELNSLVKSKGDKIISVDGVSTVNKTFKEVIQILRESGKNQFAYMRFWSSKYSICPTEFTSVGDIGKYILHTLTSQFRIERRLAVRERRENAGVKTEEKQIESEDEEEALDDEKESEDEESEGEYLDSEDEDVILAERVKIGLAKMEKEREEKNNHNTIELKEGIKFEDIEIRPDSLDEVKRIGSSIPADQVLSTSTDAFNVERAEPNPVTSVAVSIDVQRLRAEQEDIKLTLANNVYSKPCQETTRSLSLRLIDIDVGYSSDEGGEEDIAYFYDGVDKTFSTKKEMHFEPPEDNMVDSETATKEKEMIPVKKSEFSTLGNCTKFFVASMLTSSQEPCPEQFHNYPEVPQKALKEKNHLQESNDGAKYSPDTSKPTRSMTKIEQLSSTSNEVIRVWPSAEEASATLQVPIQSLLQILNDEYNEDVGDEVGGFHWRYASEDAQVEEAPKSGRDSKKGKMAYLEFRDKLYSHANPRTYKGGHKLRDYQVDGINWLASCWYKRHSCILADEMGLGKTVQIVTYIDHLYRVEKIKRPFLVVVPLSTVEHWRREFEGWTDMICCVYHDRQREWRDVMREYEWYYADRPHTPDYLKFDVLVTTYDTLIGDYDVIGNIPWRVTVVDEAHRLRNVKGKLLECMRNISAKGTLTYGYQSRVLMTGTPLQNNTQELWTLLNFIEPYKFPSLEEFMENFGNMANREQVEALQRKISPFMLRRVKEDVAKDIPSKEETLIDVELTSIQKQYYRAIFEHNHAFLSMGATRATTPKLMNIQMELRKCCNHPFLLDGVEHRELEKFHNELLDSGELENKTPEENQLTLNIHGYIKTSGKMVLLDKLLPKLRQEGHKVLIFSQMVRMLDLISEFCDFRGFKHERLDGRVRGNERQKAIDRFETEEDSFAFLLSTRAGGVGINLTAADICIIFDSDWNPQNDVQAQARCHRIGQTKDVMIYRLVTSRTFEQEMFDRASKKLGLEQAVLGTFGQDNEDVKPTSKEMEQLLKKGAYALLEDDGDEMTRQFCEDDIDSILAKRTRTRVVEGAKTASWLNKQGMNVTKSKFTGDSSTATANVNVDDPLFWQKVMPDFVTPAIMMAKLKEMSKFADKHKHHVVEIHGEHGHGKGRRKRAIPGKKMNGAENSDKSDNINLGKDGKEFNKDEHEPVGSHSEIHGKGNKNEKNPLPPSRTLQKKANKFMADLSSMMEGVFENIEDDKLPQSEKTVCQKLLLTISAKEKIFTEEQRNLAKIILKRLEGDRRRRCRSTGDGEPARFSSRGGVTEEEVNETEAILPEGLLIRHKIKRRKKRAKGVEKDITPEVKKKSEPLKEKDEGCLGDDGYLHHSDSEADWSDVGHDLYKSKGLKTISKKEARRRRAWASDKDPAKAAGCSWPVFPRNTVKKVLRTMLDEVIKHDQAKGGLFSVPVPPDVFPEYYEVVKTPMDYGSMKEKLAQGEYRSAQGMQKDFMLVMQNCLQFNAPDSDIVKEARKQALTMPSLLKISSMKHNLFLAEDGTILEVVTDEEEYAIPDDEDEEKGAIKKHSSRKKKVLPSVGKIPKIPTVRKILRCKKCNGCKRKDCGKCSACIDKRKFGGKGTLKQGCHLRQCANMKEQAMKISSKRNRAGNDSDNPDVENKLRSQAKKTLNASDDDVSSSETKDEPTLHPKKPRIRISLTGNGTKRKERNVLKVIPPTVERKRRRKGKSSIDEDEDTIDANDKSDHEVEKPRKRKKESSVKLIVVRRKKKKSDLSKEDKDPDEPTIAATLSSVIKIPKKSNPLNKADSDLEEGEINGDDDSLNTDTPVIEEVTLRKRNSKRRSTNLKESSVCEETEHITTEDPASKHIDLESIKLIHSELNGSFVDAREHFTKRGPWILPKSVRDEKYIDVATHTLNKVCRHDNFNIFANAVTDEEAPGYSEVVKNPMSFAQMRKKLENGEYGEGSDCVNNLYHDFLLIFDNCSMYNDTDSEIASEAARVMSYIPESYAIACAAVAEKKRGRKRKKKDM